MRVEKSIAPVLPKSATPTPASDANPEYPLSAIEDAVRSIQFGTVQIVIQDGRIVQIEKTEKIRLR
ncbi:MAG: YezD family protein [Armatimonadetes bacterium]|nr:YezD family protein [Armatimonadota bacterium]